MGQLMHLPFMQCCGFVGKGNLKQNTSLIVLIRNHTFK